jgi:hypothetical protein
LSAVVLLPLMILRELARAVLLGNKANPNEQLDDL